MDKGGPTQLTCMVEIALTIQRSLSSAEKNGAQEGCFGEWHPE
jgi:hypothetical protein